MNRKVFKIFIKSLIEQTRDWRTLGTSLVLPVIFMIIFGLAFGTSYYTYKIFVLDQDQAEAGQRDFSRDFINRLQEAKYEDGTDIFEVVLIETRKGTGVKLQKRNVAALITIPVDFSSTMAKWCQSSAAPEAGVIEPCRIGVEGDPAFPAFSLVKMMIDAIVSDFISGSTGFKPVIQSEAIYIGTKRKGSEFDYIAPGLMLFAIFMLIFQVSMVLVKESEQKTLRRMLLSRLRTWELLWGISLTQVLLAAIMIPIMVAAAVSVGFSSQGSLFNGMVVGILTAFSAIALGLWVAAFSRNSTQAFLVSNALIVPVVFLSGTFFPLPKITLFHLGERAFTLFEIQPATHAVNAFNRIFLYGAGLGDIVYELTMLVVLSALFFITGLWIWKYMHLKRV